MRATVIGISDGDTIRVRLDDGTVERVRYVGIDAPEIAHPEDGIAAECYGAEATAADADLVAGKVVLLERDVSDRDRFGRLLRHVWLPTRRHEGARGRGAGAGRHGVRAYLSARYLPGR